MRAEAMGTYADWLGLFSGLLVSIEFILGREPYKRLEQSVRRRLAVDDSHPPVLRRPVWVMALLVLLFGLPGLLTWAFAGSGDSRSNLGWMIVGLLAGGVVFFILSVVMSMCIRRIAGQLDDDIGNMVVLGALGIAFVAEMSVFLIAPPHDHLWVSMLVGVVLGTVTVALAVLLSQFLLPFARGRGLGVIGRVGVAVFVASQAVHIAF